MMNFGLGNRGLSHVFLLMVVVVLIAIGGVFSIVVSQASVDKSYGRTQIAIDRAPPGSKDKIVKIARQQLGYTEKPVNKVKFFDWAGDRPGAPGPWCSVFVTWVWHTAGVRLNGELYPKQPGVAQVRDTGMRGGQFHKRGPKVGDAILYGPNGSDHIGIVERIAGSKIYVIEGNSGLRNQADKHVIRRKINLKKPVDIPYGVIYGYVTPPGL